MGETFIAKGFASAVAALVMYWMYIPPSYAVIIVLIVMDTIFGGAVAFRDDKFRVRELFWGIFRKFAAFPMFWICDMIEQPLHVGFHLETVFALAVMAFEFISVVQGYADLGGPGAAVLITVSQRVRAALNSASIPTEVKQVETTTKRVEVEPTDTQPAPPAPVTITTVKETHTEAVKTAPDKP